VEVELSRESLTRLVEDIELRLFRSILLDAASFDDRADRGAALV
jgi:hypothetical protein